MIVVPRSQWAEPKVKPMLRKRTNPKVTTVDVHGVPVVLARSTAAHGAFDVFSPEGARYGTIVPGTGASMGRRGPTSTPGWVPYGPSGNRLTAPSQVLKKLESLSRLVHGG